MSHRLAARLAASQEPADVARQGGRSGFSAAKRANSGLFSVIKPAARHIHGRIGIMLALRLAMIQHEPAMTRKTISRPKARATILFV